jgi:hypothetical protein
MRWIIDKKINAYAVLLGNPEGRFVDVMIIRKTCFKEIRPEDANWIRQNPDRIR